MGSMASSCSACSPHHLRQLHFSCRWLLCISIGCIAAASSFDLATAAAHMGYLAQLLHSPFALTIIKQLHLLSLAPSVLLLLMGNLV